jgi:hypothetical protein
MIGQNNGMQQLMAALMQSQMNPQPVKVDEMQPKPQVDMAAEIGNAVKGSMAFDPLNEIMRSAFKD